MNKKELVKTFLENGTPERVPVAMWWHFVSFHDHYNALSDPKVFQTVKQGQKDYFDQVQPDLVKIMSDGFFGHPSVTEHHIETVEDLSKIHSIDTNHPWMDEQINYVKEVCEHIGDDVYKYYNIFSPLQYIRLRFEEYDEDFSKFVRLFKESPETMTKAAKAIAADIKVLLKRLFEETPIDGIYYSVQAVQSADFDHEKHKELVEPLDLEILSEINKYTDNILLHICGYGNYTNKLEWYADYPVKVFNWATHTEGIDLAEGKKIFKDKPVMGGFDNMKGSILYEGSEEELRATIFSMLDKAGTKGVALGADCTISADIKPGRLDLIRNIAVEYSSRKN